jgi:hypothetical protein
MKTSDFIDILEFTNQLRIIHWQTPKYPVHVAIGDLYDKMSNHIDKLVELSIGGGLEFNLDSTDVTLSLTDAKDDNKQYIINFRDWICGCDGDEGIKNIIADIINDLNQTIYLLGLS